MMKAMLGIGPNGYSANGLKKTAQVISMLDDFEKQQEVA
jgi:hypothetical protein